MHISLHRYVAQRKKQVQPATVNRDIAALSKLFSYALECGEIDTHPLVRFPKLKRHRLSKTHKRNRQQTGNGSETSSNDSRGKLG